MELSEFCDRLDARLRTDAYTDLDPSANGLQVGARSKEVDHVAFAVDAAIETAERATEVDADALVVHHGLFWGEFERATGPTYDRLTPFFENDISLFVSHLPLDAHPELGNAAGVADALELEDCEPFGTLGGEFVGQWGTAVGFSSTALRDRLDTEVSPQSGVQVLDFGPEEIEDVAIVTGSGTDWVAEATEAGVDAFVTGEGKQSVYHEAREADVHVFLAGHYATETFGVRSLQDLVEEWDVETTFIDCPTGL